MVTKPEPPLPSAWEWLLRDVAACCVRCAATVEATSGDAEIALHRDRALEALALLGEAVEEALRVGAKDGTGLAMLVEINHELEILRRTHLPFFAHYDSDARYLTLLAAELADEAGFAIRTPIVGNFSSAGYWTDPGLSTICLPAGDHDQLLALPDLVHELVHLQLSEAGDGLVGSFLGRSVGPYASNLGAVEGDAEYGSRLMADYRDWAAEWVADITATYVCGRSYGWQNFRLSAQSVEAAELWLPARPSTDGEYISHPADSARATVVHEVLRRIGDGPDATRLDAEWAELIAHAGPRPATFCATYPRSVLDDLVTMTLDWCRESDITPRAEAGSDSIVGSIDCAWTEHLAGPDSTHPAEAARIADLRARIEANA